MRMSAQILPQDPAFHSFGYIARSRIAGTYGNSVFGVFKN